MSLSLFAACHYGRAHRERSPGASSCLGQDRPALRRPRSLAAPPRRVWGLGALCRPPASRPLVRGFEPRPRLVPASYSSLLRECSRCTTLHPSRTVINTNTMLSHNLTPNKRRREVRPSKPTNRRSVRNAIDGHRSHVPPLHLCWQKHHSEASPHTQGQGSVARSLGVTSTTVWSPATT